MATNVPAVSGVGGRFTPNHLRTQRHKLQAMRVAGWFVFLLEVYVLAACCVE
jgi:hypothetical protein